ncbi:T9SS type A sorting domain-containing protein [Foetidibacter luteolus]|uniref:T9SS type A sorting domain-containing protein n=1 Tax=Foetidibacter luteolus TaxID=2608880 RepID=UPI00129AE36B|nr:T9SS type A sorting domain-containing protein [Foetidibacter luteolus]
MRYLLLLASVIITVPVMSQASLIVGSGAYLSGGGNAYLVLAGNIRSDGTVNLASSSTTNFNGSSQQRITCIAGSGCTSIYNSSVYPVSLGNVLQNNSNGIAVEVNTTVAGTHTFSSGTAEIKEGIYWLTNTSTPYSGINAPTGRFFTTTGRGLLKQSGIGSTRVFPVGTSGTNTQYTPASVSYSGTADNFGIRVMDNIYYDYNAANGDPIGTTTNFNFVEKTWIVKKDNRVTGDQFTVTLQWNAANENAAFATHRSTDVTIGRHHDATWFPQAQGPASGSNPYTLSGTVTYDAATYEYYPVSATAINTVLATTALQFTGSLSGNKVSLVWSTTADTKTTSFHVQRSTNGIDFFTMGSVTATGATGYYSYTDNLGSNTAPLLYYRLQLSDGQGNSTFSKIVAVKPGPVNGNVIVYPNPTSSYIRLKFKNVAGNYQVTLTDISGRILRTATVNNADYFMPCAGIPAGNYLVTVTQLNTKSQSYHYVCITQ